LVLVQSERAETAKAAKQPQEERRVRIHCKEAHANSSEKECLPRGAHSLLRRRVRKAAGVDEKGRVDCRRGRFDCWQRDKNTGSSSCARWVRRGDGREGVRAVGTAKSVRRLHTAQNWHRRRSGCYGQTFDSAPQLRRSELPASTQTHKPRRRSATFGQPRS
jgi:hypothetical protein